MSTDNKKWKVRPHLKYTETHEWLDPATGKVGITDFAQSNLSDVVYFENKVDVGETVSAGQPIGAVESVKTNSDINSPLSGILKEINQHAKLEVINHDPYDEGWMFIIEGVPPSNLMDSAAYEKYCEERSH